MENENTVQEVKKEKNTDPSYRYICTNPFTGEKESKLFKDGHAPVGCVFVESKEGTSVREKYGQYFAYRWTSRASELKTCLNFISSEEGMKMFSDVKVVVEQFELGDIVTHEKKEKRVREKKVKASNPEAMGRSSSKRQHKFFASEDTETITDGEPTQIELMDGFAELTKPETFTNKKAAVARAKELGLSSEVVQKIDDSWQIVRS